MKEVGGEGEAPSIRFMGKTDSGMDSRVFSPSLFVLLQVHLLFAREYY